MFFLTVQIIHHMYYEPVLIVCVVADVVDVVTAEDAAAEAFTFSAAAASIFTLHVIMDNLIAPAHQI